MWPMESHMHSAKSDSYPNSKIDASQFEQVKWSYQSEFMQTRIN